MKDRFLREIDYIRISVTDRCNFRCRYCMPVQGVGFIPHDQILRFEEIIRIGRLLPRIGIKHIKITGGEPLVRKGICSLIKDLKALEGIEQVTLTTNGYLLEQAAEKLKAAGIDAVNVSVDTVNRENFTKICRKDGLTEVLRGIDTVQELGIALKVNTVVSGNSTLAELLDVLDFFSGKGITVRFIELMPIGIAERTRVTNADLFNLIKRHHPDITKDDFRSNGPARYYQFGDGKRVGFISAVHDMFCSSCNRVRLTAEGVIKPCLASTLSYNIKRLLRSGAGDAELERALKQAVFHKPVSHHFNNRWKTETRVMNTIGG